MNKIIPSLMLATVPLAASAESTESEIPKVPTMPKVSTSEIWDAPVEEVIPCDVPEEYKQGCRYIQEIVRHITENNEPFISVLDDGDVFHSLKKTTPDWVVGVTYHGDAQTSQIKSFSLEDGNTRQDFRDSVYFSGDEVIGGAPSKATFNNRNAPTLPEAVNSEYKDTLRKYLMYLTEQEIREREQKLGINR